MTGKVTKVAIKKLRGVQTDLIVLERTIKRLNRETWVWQILEHKNVLSFLGVCRDFGPSTVMISPLCNNGDAPTYLVNNPKADRLVLVTGVAQGLEYLHSMDVIHGDLKGHNIMVDDNGTPQLSDFGQSKLVDRRGFTTATFTGSTRYMAPELLPTESEDEVLPKVTKESDVYGFSMVALEILTGRIPFCYWSADSIIMTQVHLGKRPIRAKYLPTIIAEPMWELLVHCWDQDPGERPVMQSAVGHLRGM